MCGYCTESAALSSALLSLKRGASIEADPFILPSCIQDAANWAELVRAGEGNNSETVALLAFCRRWENALRGEALLPLLDVIDPTLWGKLRERLNDSMPGSEWAWAIEPGGALPADFSLSSALNIVETYSDCWLTGGSSERWSDQTFERWFPWLFLSLVIVAEAEVEAEAPVLQTIALTDPHRTPAFDGLDLWLQRRAACACVRQLGLAFVEEHFYNLRLEVLASTLLSEVFHSSDLVALQNLLADRSHWVMNLTVEELLAATVHKLAGGLLDN